MVYKNKDKKKSEHLVWIAHLSTRFKILNGNMKEIKIWLDTPQVFFLVKIMNKIEEKKGGFDNIYGSSTLEGLRVIVDRGYYTDIQKSWLNSMREDYLECFCR